MKYAVIAALFMLLVGCVQSPTQNTQVVDDRPGLTFSLANEAATEYELQVDGISYGAVGQYQEGENVLRLIDGTHRVELIAGGEVVYSQKVYLGAGVNRVIKVGANDQ
ncbi:hypothetical protein [Marinimicrobium locisalis]|uniref:hypothetical protein n=1 Tax=Marinimicrobium locisalis TaxID=546022 RepID=UPI00322155E0